MAQHVQGNGGHGGIRLGEDYDDYLNSGVSFYVPVLDRSGLELTSAVANLEGVQQ